jgi:murein DD-endopeptidase MepM/ murein hydrolase activator NlpD
MSGRSSLGYRHHVLADRRGFDRTFPSRPGPPRITLSRKAAIGAAAGVVAVALWALGATGVVLFRDDVVTGLIRRERTLQYDYEGRIATLKAELARVQSKQLVDSQAFADKVDALARRQSSLESRQSIVQSLGEIAASAGIRLAPGKATADEPEPAADPAVTTTPQPLPDSDSIVEVKPGKQARLDIKPARHASMIGGLFGGDAQRPASVATTLAGLSASIDRLEQHQMAALLAIGTRARGRVERIRDTLDDVGVDPDRLMQKAAKASAEGGPFIPLALSPNASPFEDAAYTVQKELAAADALNRGLASVPLHRPFPHAEITSGFGARVDPFLGSTALHAGIDFREETGAPVRATASGRVNEAGWVGGYGNMVEIDHGNGLATRYGHMSQILVTPGETVSIGQVIGRVGSTGRSTGPHRHYETRIGGVAVDPMRFIRAERSLDEPS